MKWFPIETFLLLSSDLFISVSFFSFLTGAHTEVNLNIITRLKCTGRGRMLSLSIRFMEVFGNVEKKLFGTDLNLFFLFCSNSAVENRTILLINLFAITSVSDKITFHMEIL